MSISTVTVHADGTSATVPIVVSQPSGALTFDGRASLGTKPYSTAYGGGQAGGVQAGNAPYDTPMKNNRWRGDFSVAAAPDGTACFTMTNPALAAGTVLPDGSTCTLEAVGINDGNRPFVDMLDECIGLSIWVPAGGLVIPNATKQVNIGEWGMTDMSAGGGQPSVCLMAHSGTQQVLAQINAGPWNATAKDYEYGGWNLPVLPVFPTLVPGTWNSMILHGVWTTTTSGLLESYYRAKGQAWQRSPWSYSGKPTVNWVTSTPSSVDGQLLNYGDIFDQGQPCALNHFGMLRGPLAAVQAALP